MNVSRPSTGRVIAIRPVALHSEAAKWQKQPFHKRIYYICSRTCVYTRAFASYVYAYRYTWRARTPLPHRVRGDGR
jgi:hypothetical protein